jgi:hypothetical protein
LIEARATASCGADLENDERGAVYVEFLLAFMPLFVLFLAICQLALIASARLVVQHAALSGVRSAIVVLEEHPDDYDRAPRGNLSEGRPTENALPETLLAGFGFQPGRADLPAPPSDSGCGAESCQRGARMVPIRTGAYSPLLVLAPNEAAVGTMAEDSLGSSLPGSFASRIGFSLAYTRAASVVTLHTRSGTDDLAREPIDGKAPVTLRVSYLYHCGVPLVRALICRTFASLLGTSDSPLSARIALSEAPGEIARLASPDARFFVLSGEATLPNQGAGYY